MGWNYQGSIEEFFKVHAQSFDFMKRISPWAEFFGSKKIFVRLFEKSLIGEDVCADFLQMLEVNLVNYQPLKSPSNESILPDFSDIIFFIDKNKPAHKEREKIIKNILDLSKRFRPFSSYSLINGALSDKIRKFYASSNEEFAKIFLPKEQFEKFLT